MELEEIKKIAIRFREVLNHMSSNGAFENARNFRNFPRGSCGDVSELFIYYMYCEHNIKSDYWLGHLANGGKHAWVKINAICIDLTADQFNSNSSQFSEVIVCQQEDYPLKSMLVRQNKGVGPSFTDINNSIYYKIKEALCLV